MAVALLRGGAPVARGIMRLHENVASRRDGSWAEEAQNHQAAWSAEDHPTTKSPAGSEARS